jgi:hypothetical protein
MVANWPRRQRLIPLPARRCTISCKASRYSSLRDIWTDLGGYRRHEDYCGRGNSRYWEDHRRGIMPTPVFLPQNLAFAPPGRKGAGASSAAAPVVVSGSTLPATLLSGARRSRGLGIPRGWGVLILFPSHCQVESYTTLQWNSVGMSGSPPPLNPQAKTDPSPQPSPLEKGRGWSQAGGGEHTDCFSEMV